MNAHSDLVASLAVVPATPLHRVFVAGGVIAPSGGTNALFATGRTDDSTYGNDWWTLRIEP